MNDLDELARGLADYFSLWPSQELIVLNILKQVRDQTLLEAENIAKVNGSKCTADDLHTLREKK